MIGTPAHGAGTDRPVPPVRTGNRIGEGCG
ncbi:hypothetical protein ruthe_02664 [Rubellimicrobium thermophilum DSM 16684]|uniref:Uncharacterized protein n=1 Tax=Rubellimicrobium thermophilum DSM 16684 TaxID=1123069 RepID=S9QVT2_9RHOB|nr:hypothetical protein ruthe_02664 [Rubellimicrobium thermophilum DSM 16684]